MLSIEQLYDRISKAVMLESDDAAVRVTAEYQPAAGWEAKVFPPTYREKGEKERKTYVFEKRWDGSKLVDVVLLDSVQSQAGRVEAALDRAAAELGIPRLVLEVEADGQVVRISSLTASHRSRDAYFRDSCLNGQAFDKSDLGGVLLDATADSATALLRHVPNDLVFGVWDSHRGRRVVLKVARSYVTRSTFRGSRRFR